MSFDEASVLVDGGLSNFGIWAAVFATSLLLAFLALGISKLVARVVPSHLRTYFPVAVSAALLPFSGLLLASLSSVPASVLSFSVTRICFMPTRHVLRDFLPGALALAFTLVRVLSSQRDRPAV
jgi:hypothetical protein